MCLANVYISYTSDNILILHWLIISTCDQEHEPERISCQIGQEPQYCHSHLQQQITASPQRPQTHSGNFGSGY